MNNRASKEQDRTDIIVYQSSETFGVAILAFHLNQYYLITAQAA